MGLSSRSLVAHGLLTHAINHKVPARDQTRDTVDLIINLRADIAERLSTDRSTGAMIYSASEPMSPFSKVEIEFPYQLEIRINQDEVQANFRGLKNKPGTTRPVDITTMLRPKPGYDNHMVVTYALTKKVSLRSSRQCVMSYWDFQGREKDLILITEVFNCGQSR